MVHKIFLINKYIFRGGGDSMQSMGELCSLKTLLFGELFHFVSGRLGRFPTGLPDGIFSNQKIPA
jgi:hypothetical protein